jgi:hypothetical protein
MLRSIRSKWPIFKLAAEAYNLSIVAITETWLTSDFSSAYVYGDYSQFSACRQSPQPGGGVMLLFNPSFKVVQVAIPVKPPSSCDVLVVVETLDGHCWVVVYRPSSCTTADTLSISSPVWTASYLPTIT